MLSNPQIKILKSTDTLQITNRQDFASRVVLNIISTGAISQTITIYNTDGSQLSSFSVSTPARVILSDFRIGKLTLSDTSSYTVIASVLQYPVAGGMKPELDIVPLQVSQQSVSSVNLNKYNQINVLSIDTSLLTVPPGKRWVVSGIIISMFAGTNTGTRQFQFGYGLNFGNGSIYFLDTGPQTGVSSLYVSYLLMFETVHLSVAQLGTGGIGNILYSPMIFNAGDALSVMITNVSGDAYTIEWFGYEENAV